MKKNLDTIKFEHRYEIQELMEAVDKLVKHCPEEKNNKSLKRFFGLLDAMDMEW